VFTVECACLEMLTQRNSFETLARFCLITSAKNLQLLRKWHWT